MFIFLLPAIQVTFFCAAVGRDPTDLRVAVVNEEASVISIIKAVKGGAEWSPVNSSNLNLIQTWLPDGQ